MSLQIELLKHQLEFCNDYDTKYLGLVGGYGCGKTFSFCVKTVLLASVNYGFRGVIMEPNFGMVKRTLIPEMERTLELMQVPYDFKISDMKFTLHFEEGSTEVMCLSAENYRRMAGLNLAFFGVDEVDTIKKDIATSMWRMGMSRLREGRIYQGFTSSTPEGFNFLYDFFVGENESGNKTDRKLIKGKTRDNPFIPDEFIQSLLDNYPPNLIKSYLEGDFTNLTSGTIYYAFDRKLNHTDLTINDFKGYPLHIGQDFNIGKCASVVHVIKDGLPLAVDEIMGAKNTEEVIKQIKSRYPNRKITIYPDASGRNEKTSAAQSDLTMLKQAGFELNYSNKNPYVKDRVNSMNAMFCSANGKRRYLINTKACPTYTRALEQQVYNKVGEPDKSHDQDHPNDAAGYFINRNYPITGQPTIRVY
jgi:PBSX family phage terminase large subunit